ncbi:MAG: hypothetical protein ABW046_08980, partial [Actinoplanes sp.]
MAPKQAYVDPDSVLARTARKMFEAHAGGRGPGDGLTRCPSCGEPLPCAAGQAAAEVLDAAGLAEASGLISAARNGLGPGLAAASEGWQSGAAPLDGRYVDGPPLRPSSRGGLSAPEPAGPPEWPVRGTAAAGPRAGGGYSEGEPVGVSFSDLPVEDVQPVSPPSGLAFAGPEPIGPAFRGLGSPSGPGFEGSHRSVSPGA